MLNAGDLELCFQAMAARLQGIRTENGFQHDVVKVYRSFLLLDALDSLESPAIMVGRTPGDHSQFEPFDDRGYEVDVPFTIVGFIRRGAFNAEDDDAATRGEAFLSDLVRLAMADRKWGSPMKGSGCIKDSILLSGYHTAAYDDSGIQVELNGRFTTVTDGVNP